MDVFCCLDWREDGKMSLDWKWGFYYGLWCYIGFWKLNFVGKFNGFV